MIKEFIYATIERMRLARARWRANTYSYFQNGRKYYVIKLQGKYRVMNCSDIKAAKKAGIFQRSVNFWKLDNLAVYITPPKH